MAVQSVTHAATTHAAHQAPQAKPQDHAPQTQGKTEPAKTATPVPSAKKIDVKV